MINKKLNNEMTSLIASDENISYKMPKIGDIVQGVIFYKDDGKMLIDMGGLYAGEVAGKEMLDSADKWKDLDVSDEVEVMVIDEEDKNGLLQLSLRRSVAKRAWSDISDMVDADKVVSIKIKSANSGGLLADLQGVRGFLPVSQLSPEHYPRVEGGSTEKIIERLGSLIGESVEVKVIGFDQNVKKLIFSERALGAARRDEIIKTLEKGQMVEGSVTGIFTYGLFVAFNGVEGLVHISEIAWGHVSSPNKYAKVGDKVKCEVISAENGKISLSMKRLADDPWVGIASKYSVGDEVISRVKQFVDFGMFVEITNDMGGLIHISQIDWENISKEQMHEMYNVGDEIAAKIILLDIESHKIGLSIKELKPMPAHIKAEIEAKKNAGLNLDVSSAPKSEKKEKVSAKKEESVDDVIEEITHDEKK